MKKEDLIIKWMNGELSKAEEKALESLPDFESYKKIYDHASHFKSPKVDAEEQYKRFQQTQDKIELQTTKGTPSFYYLLRLVAIFIIGFGVFFVFFDKDILEIQTPYAQKNHVNLPDRSEVELNADSFLSFDKDKWDESRKVELKGEAYFKVAKGKTFEVETELGKVRVLGTQFNVKQRQGIFEVVCYEGLVSVSTEKFSLKLPAGNRILISNGVLSKGSTDQLAPSWIKGKSSFESIPYFEVIKEFERQFDTKVELSQIDTSMTFTGSFDHSDKDLALKSITQPFSFKYSKSETGIVIQSNE